MGDCSSNNCNPCGPDFNAINQLATKAAAYARQANTYAVNAENSFLEFNALYLGAFATPPLPPLQIGALYWNSASNELFAWSGSVWLVTNNFNEFTNFISNGTTASRNLITRFGEISNISDFGADPTGATPSNVAVSAMAAAKGYVIFPQGSFLLNSITINVPLYFQMGSNVIAGNGQVVTIQNSIESPRQYIFQKTGTGSYVLGHAGTTGENARQIHVSWFGAFPNPQLGPDQSPFIQNACDAVGNTRESQILFDIGNYNMLTGVAVPRGCNIYGCGTRRTVFKIQNDGFPAFRTLNVAVKFTGIQFELHSGTPTRNSEWIRLDHEDADLTDVNIGRSAKGIVVNALNCRLNQIGGLWISNYGASSSAIEINKGSCYMNELIFGSGNFGPEAIVNIGENATSNISSVSISGLQYITPSKGILITAKSANISRLYVDGFIYNGFNGTNPDCAIHLKTDNTYSISEVVLESGAISPYANNGIKIQQNSTGTAGIEKISINNIVIGGSSGDGIQFIRTAGNLQNITIGAGSNIIDRPNPISVSGNVFNLKIDPNALPNAKNATCYDFTIANDSVASIDLFQSVFTGFLLVSVSNVEYGFYLIRAASSPSVTTINQSANMNPVTTILTGTTGPIGDFSVGITNGTIYLENRTGVSNRISANIFTGI